MRQSGYLFYQLQSNGKPHPPHKLATRREGPFRVIDYDDKKGNYQLFNLVNIISSPVITFKAEIFIVVLLLFSVGVI